MPLLSKGVKQFLVESLTSLPRSLCQLVRLFFKEKLCLLEFKSFQTVTSYSRQGKKFSHWITILNVLLPIKDFQNTTLLHVYQNKHLPSVVS